MASAIALMHRLDRADFEAAYSRLETLIDRASRQPAPLAWMAKWRILRVLQKWSDDPERDAALALQATDEALRADPGCALALTMRGFASTNLVKDFARAREDLDAALEENSSESLAWLIRGTLFAFSDRGAEAVRDTDTALALSPCDPHRYFYLCLAAGARLTAGDDAGALGLAEQSARANPRHLSTLRILATAQWRLGQAEQARATVRRLRDLDPSLTAARYLETTPAGAFRVGRSVANALRAAGLPA
jgi:tetratricopeptide (TPR) repeat protein